MSNADGLRNLEEAFNRMRKLREHTQDYNSSFDFADANRLTEQTEENNNVQGDDV